MQVRKTAKGSKDRIEKPILKIGHIIIIINHRVRYLFSTASRQQKAAALFLTQLQVQRALIRRLGGSW
jgi:hypothetical protein